MAIILRHFIQAIAFGANLRAVGPEQIL